jgi:hypothetical protein
LRLNDTGVFLFDAATGRIEPETEAGQFVPALESAAYLSAHRVNVNGNDHEPRRLGDRSKRSLSLSGGRAASRPTCTQPGP